MTLDQEGKAVTLENEAVLVFAGGTLPTELLREIGVRVELHRGTGYSQSPAGIGSPA